MILTNNINNPSNKTESPLVSIIIITYNSSKYVIETLESAKNQTYHNIELIISDDCSIDNTVSLCKDWVSRNNSRFVNVEIITTPKNTGIAKNCNRGVKIAKGLWFKLIAGDDALLIDCIKNNIDFVLSDSSIKYCFSNIETYNDTFENKNLLIDSKSYDTNAKKFSELDAKYQFQVMARGVIIKGPATFINREVFASIGNYDESYTFIEDWPTFHNWLLKGHKFHYLPKKTVKYRIHSESISNSKKKLDSIPSFPIKAEKVITDLFFKYYTFKEKILFKLEYAYYKYYFSKTKISLFEKAIQRIWYVLVSTSIKERKKALHKYYNIYKKTRLLKN